MSPITFGIYVPQVSFDYAAISTGPSWPKRSASTPCGSSTISTARPPRPPVFEAWTLATYVLAQTTRLRVGHLVLCNNFRHPALLGKMATTLDVLSGGRLDLGIGSGSVEHEHHQAGLPWGTLPGTLGSPGRVARNPHADVHRPDPTTFSGTALRGG
jgi:alkanesulfonate monooxygenase SsuD/methylene tetrahydromethanopterin reductase-like flavin-dependent oxidoreductase (luciferase family)